MNFITIKSLFLLKTKLRKQKVWKMKGLTKKEKIKVKLYPKKKKLQYIYQTGLVSTIYN